MNNKVYVGNLPYSVTSEKLNELFAQYGQITDAKVISHKDSGRSKGFGFVEFATDEAAQAAIDGMHEQELEGRKLVVNIARPFQPRDGQAAPMGADDAAPAETPVEAAETSEEAPEETVATEEVEATPEETDDEQS